MATLPGTTSTRIATGAASGATQLLLIGSEAADARPLLRPIHRNTDHDREPPIATAQSILEAVLMSDPLEPGAPAPTIVTGISQELLHLESAVRSLRRVNPTARIVLLCEPFDEAVCRRALAWGADEYFILPLDSRSAQKITATDTPKNGRARMIPERVARHPSASAVQPHAHAGNGAAHHKARHDSNISTDSADLPALPLMVQTELLDDLAATGAAGADFAERAVTVLRHHLPFEGTLQFVATGIEPPPPAEHRLRRTVSQPDQPAFGELILDLTSQDSPSGAQESDLEAQDPAHSTQTSPALTATLAQAANWLASMLALSRRYEQLRSMAITDELSGAYNRRYFMKFMSGLIERARENQFHITLLLFDIDDFKKYNDQFGHASGDAIIRELIKLLRVCTRPHDLVARIGGDEFAVVYWDNEAPRQPNSKHPKDILVATERFRKAIKDHQWSQACNIKGELSISGGLATFPWDADALELLMSKADQALLQAKAAGKNVIVMHAPPPTAADPATPENT